MTAARWFRHDRLDSTSLHARRKIDAARLAAADGPAVILASEQDGGVGRFGRAWSSPRGGLWLTLAAPIDGDIAALMDGLGLRIGLACLDTVREAVPAPVRDRIRLKWPNDMLLEDRKVAGVLGELARGPGKQMWLLVGFGLNANFATDDLPAALQSSATTLATHGLGVNLDALAARFVARLLAIIDSPGLSEAELCRARSEFELHSARSVSMPNGERIEATFIDLDRSGQALFRTADGREFALPSVPATADE